MVDDYNSWCGHFRYYERDLQTVDAEVAEKSMALAAEGRGIANGWRRSYTQAPAVRDSVEPSFSVPALPSIPSPGSVASANLSNGPKPADIDLLEVDTSTNTQKRLNELGYFRGPINGAWGPQSRNSLRLFKKANGLPDDDAFDALTASRLFSSSAISGQPQAKGPVVAQAATSESTYPPPVGATLNPLNRQDAMKIHAKLRELGFYRANSATLWSAASREALKEFKISNALDSDDRWDAPTEQRLLSASPDIDSGFAAATGGTWSIDTRACPGAGGGSDALPVTITQKRAVTVGAYCEFSDINGQGTSWKALGTCVVNGETRKSNVSFVRTGDMLVWSSANGTTKYLRCSN
jgi:peptidoglycan hydrolase-like protein with peptidoglycan-binding domain